VELKCLKVSSPGLRCPEANRQPSLAEFIKPVLGENLARAEFVKQVSAQPSVVADCAERPLLGVRSNHFDASFEPSQPLPDLGRRTAAPSFGRNVWTVLG
jgi:hypothetical protein